MIELRVLGTFAVRETANGHGRDLPLAPRQAALLAYLALARPRARVTRDRLLGVFWPELPEDRARAALSNSLYRLRVELGRDLVASGGDTDVELRWDQVQCDALAFDDALDQVSLEPALDQYGGELLAGFHLPGTPEFERWLDGERTRLRQRAVQAASTLAQYGEGAGNPAAAANWLRRALAWAPYEEPLIRDLTRLLAAIGDRSGALHEYDVFAARLAKDLELQPSLALQAAITALRTAEAAGEAVPQPSPRPSVPAPGNHTEETPRADSDRMATAIARDRPGAPSDRPAGWPGLLIRRTAVSLAGAAVLGAVMLQCFGDSMAGPDSVAGPVELRPNRVLVLAFENRTEDATVATVGRMAADWVTQSLQRSGLVEVIDPNTAFQLLGDVQPLAAGGFGLPQLRQIAEGARAGIIVWGSVSRRNGGLEFQVQIIDARESKVLRTLDPVTASSDDLTPALEVLRERVAGALATVVDERLASIVAASSPPPTFEAYQEYALGLDHFAPGSYPEAVAHFERAAHLDSTFIMARFWTVYALANSGQRARRDSLILTLVPLRDRLPPADRAGLDVFAADVRGDWETAVAAARRAAQLAPQSSWAYMVAYYAAELGRPQEALAALAELDPTRGWLKGWPGYWAVRMGALHQLGKYEEELAVARLAQRIVRADLGPQILAGELKALAALGRVEELHQRLDSLLPAYLGMGSLRQQAAELHWFVGVELVAHGFADESRRYFERCLELREDHPECMYQLGRYADVHAYWRSLADSLANPVFLNWTAKPAARLGLRDEAERIVAGMTKALYGGREWRVRAEQARIAALLGQRERAVGLLQELIRQEPMRGSLWEFLHQNLFGDFDSVRDSLRDDPFIAAVLRASK